MDAESFKNYAEGIGAFLAASALVAAGVIFLWKREWRTRLQTQVGIESFCKIGNQLLIEPICIVENKGLLRCYVYRLDLSVLYLKCGDLLEQGGEGLLMATRFPHKAVKVQFVKPEYEWSYVEAGIPSRRSCEPHSLGRSKHLRRRRPNAVLFEH